MQTLAYAIEQSIAEGAAEFDFVQGEETYKTHWATHTRDNWRVRAASPHLRGRLSWWRIQATESVTRLVAQIFVTRDAADPQAIVASSVIDSRRKLTVGSLRK